MTNSTSGRRRWDVFLSHASEDNADVIHPLTEMLLDAGLRVWVDHKELQIGDRLLQRISEGLRLSRFGVVVFSPSFFGKQWTEAELEGLFQLDQQGASTILPVWHEIGLEDVRSHSPMLAGRLAVTTTSGVASVAAALYDRITDARGARKAALRKRILDVQRSREALGSAAVLSIAQVAELTGARPPQIRRWVRDRWIGINEAQSQFDVKETLAISVLNHWTAVMPPKDLHPRIPGTLRYAIRAAQIPLALVCDATTNTVSAISPPEDIAFRLSGGPAIYIFHPEPFLLELHERIMSGSLPTS